jgi:hypothetical protein
MKLDEVNPGTMLEPLCLIHFQLFQYTYLKIHHIRMKLSFLF